MRPKSSLATLAGVAMLAAACAAPIVTPSPQPSTRVVVPPPTATAIGRVVDVGAAPIVAAATPTPVPIRAAPTAIPAAPTAPTPRPAAPSPVGVAATPSAPAGQLADGTYVVGTDIAPGTYRTAGGPHCYWARLKGFGGASGDVVTNGLPTATELVTVAPSDVGFTSRGCGAWTKVS